MDDSLIGVSFDENLIDRKIGEGAIGSVYHAYNQNLRRECAIKFIRESKLKPEWMNEIVKVNMLGSSAPVVKYLSHGEFQDPSNGERYKYIVWEYFEGKSLKEIITRGEITITILVDVFQTVLEALEFCKKYNVEHTDLHSGNVLVSNTNLSLLNPGRTIKITDFGYISPYSNKDYLDDYDGLIRLIRECINSIDVKAIMDPTDRKKYQILKDIMPTYIRERDCTLGKYVRNPRYLYNIWQSEQVKRDSSANLISRGIGDYLSAEHIGNRYDEWRSLFVPKFIALNELLERNICVLTGLRGCGKTTLFMRLSYPITSKIGLIDVPGSDSFVGFYFNASNNLSDAFPWLPEAIVPEAEKQVTSFFYYIWAKEILDWLSFENTKTRSNLNWLISFFKNLYPKEHYKELESIGNIDTLVEFINDQLKEIHLGSRYHRNIRFELRPDFLDEFIKVIRENTSLLGERPCFFFLDDYSTPKIKPTVQHIINRLIFRRSDNYMFKVSTESVESIETIGSDGKEYQDSADFQLVDCGTLSLLMSESEIKDIVEPIVEKRLVRDNIFSKCDCNGGILLKLLGNSYLTGNEISSKIRAGETNSPLYYGINSFLNLWASDVREMINIISTLVNTFREKIDLTADPAIPNKEQEIIYKMNGGEYFARIDSLTSPSKIYNDEDSNNDKNPYGIHLRKIVESFALMSIHDMVKGDLIKNQMSINPKQARRIEIKDSDIISDPIIEDYYKGLIRYGIFVRDYRGKSVNRRVVPRLYIRSSLVPYISLTFSKKDSITMNWEQFLAFLKDPESFSNSYINKKHVNNPLQIDFDDLGISSEK